jgi:hypothetical protein
MSSFNYETTGDVSLSAIVAGIIGWLRRNVLWLLLGAALGGTLSYFYNESRPKEYSSSLIGFANNLDDLRVRELIQRLHLLRATQETKELARVMNITEPEARDIVSISAMPNNTLEADLPPFPPRETKVKHFMIEATVHNPELFPKIQEGIIYYIDNVPPVKKRLENMRESTLRRIKQEQAELEYLEETKRQLLGNSKPMEVLDIGAISTHAMGLVEKLEDNQLFYDLLGHEIVLTKPMEVVHKPSSPGKYRAIGLGAAIGFFVTLGLMGFLALMRFSKVEKA